MECENCIWFIHEWDVNFYFCRMMDQLGSEEWDALCESTWKREVDANCPYYEVVE